MGKRIFHLEFEGSADIELDDQVINVVNDEWREGLYDLHTPEEIAEMVGRCMVINGAKLSSLDGWTDQPDENAIIVVQPDWETVHVREIQP